MFSALAGANRPPSTGALFNADRDIPSAVPAMAGHDPAIRRESEVGMPSKRADERADPGTPNALTSGTGTVELSPNARLQILTTEHWSLLSTRALSWNETCSRTAAFLAALSGAGVALALVAQATAFGEGFAMFALLIPPVVLFFGVATFARLVESTMRTSVGSSG